jgi:hypothetical protein
MDVIFGVWAKYVLIIMHNASACRIELPDGNYDLVHESEGEPAEGEVNVVEGRQEPNQSSEGLASDFASEGKPRSITYFC